MAKLDLRNISIETLTNMTEDDLLGLAKRGLDKSKMTAKAYKQAHRDNLAQITSRLVSTANKRIKNLGKSKIGQSSPSYQYAKKMNKSGLFSVKGKSWNELMNTMKETKQFLSRKTSTLKGWKQVRENIQEDIGGSLDTTYKSKKFWEVYRRMQETNGGIFGRKGSSSRLSSERVQRMIYNAITNTRDEYGKRTINWRSSVDKILEQSERDFKREYELSKSIDSDMGTSHFVTDDEDED